MSDLKINCPICNQEFPAYDQRGFRNAGFTAHHKKCLERQQQQNEPQHRDQQASRASRLAWAVRRRLLPARPTSSTSLVKEGQSRIDPQLPLPGSISSSSSSSTPSNRNQTEISPSMTPVVPSQVPHLKQHFYPRQRHTWNHWTSRRRSRRSTLDDDTSFTVAAPSPNTLPVVTVTTSSDSRVARSHRSLPAMNSMTDSPNFPLLTAITTMDSSVALLIPQDTVSQLPDQTPVTSPTMPGSGSPFSFTSMLTTLPLESAPLLPSTTISTCSSNSNSVTDKISVDTGYQQPPPSHTTTDPSIPTDWTPGQYHYVPSPLDTCLYHHQQQQPHPHDQQPSPHRIASNNIPPLKYASTDPPNGDTYYYHHDTTHTVGLTATASTPSPNTLPRPLRSPENLNGDDNEPIYYCIYCQPQNGQHNPTCSLMQFIMMDIIGGYDAPPSSSS